MGAASAALVGCDETSATGAPTASTAPSSAPPELTQAAVDGLVAEQRAEVIRACASALAQATQRELQLMIELDAVGAVTDATVAGGGAADQPLRACVETRLRGWRFPAPGAAPATVTATLSLVE